MKVAKTTNVKPCELNYDQYTMEQYDRDIVNSIPFHTELHEQIIDFLKSKKDGKDTLQVLDLGVGTGITSQWLRNYFSNVKITGIDFSETMLAGARKKLGEEATYILGDYATTPLSQNNDVVLCVIGLHHQTIEGAERLFPKIYDSLQLGGFLIIGDLMTVADKHQAALANARHYHHLVEHAVDEGTLREWAYHHQFLNDLKTVEDHKMWLNEAGFKVVYEWGKWNTRLLIAQKT